MNSALLNPEWLKYGISGLVCIFSILLYFLFKRQIDNSRGKSLSFLVLTIVFTFLVFVSLASFIYHSENTMKFSNRRINDSLINVIDALKFSNKVYSGDNDSISRLLTLIKMNNKRVDSLSLINSELENKISDQEQHLSSLVSGQIKSSLYYSYTKMRGKGDDARYNTDPDLQFKLLRKAVFQNIMALHADKRILKISLKYLQTMDVSITDSNVNRILAAFDSLLPIKLRWLETEVIPVLMKPYGGQGGGLEVTLPKELLITNNPDDREANSVVPDNLVSSQNELELLKRKI